MEKVKNDSLELEDEIKLHEKGWIIQRVGWAILLLLLIAAALGIFGTGWLSTKYDTKDGITVSYERFARFEAPMNIVIHTRQADGRIEIAFPQWYFRSMELDKVMPEPESQRLVGDEYLFSFNAKPTGMIKFYIIPEQAGLIDSNINVDGATFSIHHFIYP